MASVRKLCLLTGAIFLVTAFALVPPALAVPAPFYLAFSVPHSAGTYPLSINRDLVVTGYWIGKSGETHGFVRAFDGEITTFDVPGSVFTKPVSINAEGEITGYYAKYQYGGYITALGFIRDPHGVITTFGDPSAFGFQPYPQFVTNSGEIAGNFPSAGEGSIAFVRSPTGAVQSFSINEGASYSTFLTGINADGVVVGYGGSDYLDSAQGLLWNGKPPLPDIGGGYTEIDFPGSTGTFPTGINRQGEIVGCYDIDDVYYDFVRATDGTFTKLNPTGTVVSCLADHGAFGVDYDALPAAVSLNNNGTIIGRTTHAGITSSFVRFSGGTMVPYSVPGSTVTVLSSINNLDVVTGYYTKAGKTEGFIAVP